MVNNVLERLLISSITIAVLCIVILLLSKLITKRLGYRWRKAAWMIILICSIVPIRIGSLDIPEETHPVEMQEKNDSEEAGNDREKIKFSYGKATEGKNIVDKNGEEKNAEAKNMEASVSEVSDEKKEENILPKNTVLDVITDTIEKNALLIVGVWLIGVYISWNVMASREKRLKKVLSDHSFEIEEESILNRIKSIQRKVGYWGKIKVFYCTEISAPVVNGMIESGIYFPVDIDFSDEKMENVIRHEMIHLKSKDILYKKIMNYATAIYWFHPFIHIVKNKAFDDVEFVCDSKVVKDLEQNQIGLYCQSIVEAVPVKNSYLISFNNSKNRIKKRIDNCFSENRQVKHKNMYILLAGVMAVVAVTVGTIVGALVQSNEKADKPVEQIAKVEETIKNKDVLKEEKTTEVPLRLSQRGVHYDTDFSISKEKSEALKKMWLDDLSKKDCETVKEKIFSVHSYIESDLVYEFKGKCPPDSEIWNIVDDDPNDNVLPGYTIPDMILDLQSTAAIVNKSSFSERIDNLISKLRKVKKTHDIDLYYEIHQQVHDLSYWAINYPIANLETAPADWHGIYVYFGTLDDVI